MKLAFIGIGNVGLALAQNLEQQGHEITVAHDDPQSSSVQEALQKNPGFKVRPVQEAVNEAEVTFLAIPFKANEAVLKNLKFSGKVLVDCTNPVGPGISHGLESKISGAEQVQKWAPDARVVKAYTIYGYENLKDPTFPGYNVKPVMMIAGEDADSKELISKLNTDMGFTTLDTGGLSQALHLEHMTLLWVKMVRAQGHHPHFTWAYLEK